MSSMFRFIILILYALYVSSDKLLGGTLWEPLNTTTNQRQVTKSRNEKAVAASFLVKNLPVYASVTTTRERISKLSRTIVSLLNGDVVPDEIFVFISATPYLQDTGIPSSAIPKELILLAQKYHVSIIYTDNIGPHRKLIPLLARYYDEDVIIVTFDDDRYYSKSTLSQLIKYYLASDRNSVIALRVHRIGICYNSKNQIDRSAGYFYWPLMSYGSQEMLVLPTGTGGVLYRPKFFHPVVFDPTFIKLTDTGDDMTFRLVNMIRDIPVVVGCRDTLDRGRTTVCPLKARITSFQGEKLTTSHPGGSKGNKSKKSTKKNTASKKKGKGKKKSKISDETEPDEEDQVTEKAPLEHTFDTSLNLTVRSVSEEDEEQSEFVETDEILLEFSGKQLDEEESEEWKLFNSTTIDFDQQQRRRKLASLWKINRRRNDIVWSRAVKYLKQKGLLNFTTVLKTYGKRERKNCSPSDEFSKRYLCGAVRCGNK